MGFLDTIKDKGKKIAKGIDDYQKAEPERRAKRMDKLKSEISELKLKQEEMNLRQKVQKMRSAQAPKMPEMFGSGSMFGGFGPQLKKSKKKDWPF